VPLPVPVCVPDLVKKNRSQAQARALINEEKEAATLQEQVYF